MVLSVSQSLFPFHSLSILAKSLRHSNHWLTLHFLPVSADIWDNDEQSSPRINDIANVSGLGKGRNSSLPEEIVTSGGKSRSYPCLFWQGSSLLGIGFQQNQPVARRKTTGCNCLNATSGAPQLLRFIKAERTSVIIKTNVRGFVVDCRSGRKISTQFSFRLSAFNRR
ncbi:hypothetical protein AVEN_170529-1 [Araneus ventricosus]|uniref:Uncharacterized protein n=1 Tax=Araneus ventricosus TaxID=182803 RepID=A0A4Y2C1E5_ARAVE|nr:hypothetical protein AVEN_170529-1 [Araneus ventricosus]